MAEPLKEPGKADNTDLTGGGSGSGRPLPPEHLPPLSKPALGAGQGIKRVNEGAKGPSGQQSPPNSSVVMDELALGSSGGMRAVRVEVGQRSPTAAQKDKGVEPSSALPPLSTPPQPVSDEPSPPPSSPPLPARFSPSPSPSPIAPVTIPGRHTVTQPLAIAPPHNNTLSPLRSTIGARAWDESSSASTNFSYASNRDLFSPPSERERERSSYYGGSEAGDRPSEVAFVEQAFMSDADKERAVQGLHSTSKALFDLLQDDNRQVRARPGTEDWYKTRPLEGLDMAASTGNFHSTFPPRNSTARGLTTSPSAGYVERSGSVRDSNAEPPSPVNSDRPMRRRSSRGMDANRRSSLGPRSSSIGTTDSVMGKTQAVALAHKFTVTTEIMNILKAKQMKSQRVGWSPQNWGNHQSHVSTMNDVESNINAYVEYVCDDLRTAEKRRSSDSIGKFVIDPSSRWKRRWDVMILLLILYSAYSVPYKVAFAHLQNSRYDLIIDLLFMTDVIANFFTSYSEVEGVQQTSLTKIGSRYVRTWFFADFLSSIPTDLARFSDIQMVRNVFFALRLLKILRLVRFLRLVESKEAAMVVTPTILRLVNSFIILTWLWHVISCAYWYISVSEGLGASQWTPEPSSVANEDILNYFLSIVWTIQTTFSCSPLGAAETLTEALFTILCFMVGIFMNAYVIGSAGSALQNLDEEKTQKAQLLDRIINYMKKRKLPPYFQRIILDFYSYTSDKHSEDDIFKDLPPAIQLRLSLLLNRELVKNIPLLKQLELNTIVALMQTLQSSMYLPGDFVFKIGEKGEALYFVKTGQLELMLDNESVIAILAKGDMFGQVALQDENGIQDYNVRANVYSEVLFLTKATYLELAAESDKFGELVETEAIKQEQFIVRARKNLKRHKFGQGGSARNLKVSASGRNLTIAEQMAASEKMRKLKLIGDVAGALFSTSTKNSSSKKSSRKVASGGKAADSAQSGSPSTPSSPSNDPPV